MVPGFFPKVILPMLASPVMGFVGGMIVMGLLFAIIRPMRPRLVDKLFGRLQLLSASYMGWAHGFADGQKTWASWPWPVLSRPNTAT